jgi:hypothetical protein
MLSLSAAAMAGPAPLSIGRRPTIFTAFRSADEIVVGSNSNRVDPLEPAGFYPIGTYSLEQWDEFRSRLRAARNGIIIRSYARPFGRALLRGQIQDCKGLLLHFWPDHENRAQFIKRILQFEGRDPQEQLALIVESSHFAEVYNVIKSLRPMDPKRGPQPDGRVAQF